MNTCELARVSAYFCTEGDSTIPLPHTIAPTPLLAVTAALFPDGEEQRPVDIVRAIEAARASGTFRVWRALSAEVAEVEPHFEQVDRSRLVELGAADYDEPRRA